MGILAGNDLEQLTSGSKMTLSNSREAQERLRIIEFLNDSLTYKSSFKAHILGGW